MKLKVIICVVAPLLTIMTAATAHITATVILNKFSDGHSILIVQNPDAKYLREELQKKLGNEHPATGVMGYIAKIKQKLNGKI